jgi:3-phenylpropionate/trans-cinnamate dioxygenase ferredoxin subunit
MIPRRRRSGRLLARLVAVNRGVRPRMERIMDWLRSAHKGETMADFARVAGVAEVPPGEHIRVEVDGKAVLLVNLGGEFYAVSDVCTHEEAHLSEGFLMGAKIECPLHGSMFDVTTGEVKGLPATVPLSTFEVKVEGDGIYVRFPE